MRPSAPVSAKTTSARSPLTFERSGRNRASSVCYGAAVNGAVLRDAFGHHVWATLRLLDACIELTPDQLGTTVPGTYGSILDTARHVVGSDAWYLSRMTNDPAFRVDEEQMDLTEIRVVMERNDDAWTRIIEGDIDPDAVEVTPQEDGSEF